MTNPDGPTLLIDASSLLYRAYYSTPDTVVAPDGSLVNAVHGFINMLSRLISDHRPARLACATDDDWRPAWRVALLPEYKLARVAPAEPQAEADQEVGRQAELCFELIVGAGVPVLGHDGYEAEDVIGSLAERELSRGHGPVAIVSGDRDLFQLVRDPDIYVLYPIKGVSELAVINEAEITRRYGIPGRSYSDFAVLRGDPSDGLPGVKGIGEKTAAALLASHGDLDGVIAAARQPVVAGALGKVKAGLDYVEKARQVVRIPRDLPVLDLDLARPDQPLPPEVWARADALNLSGALDRLTFALGLS